MAAAAQSLRAQKVAALQAHKAQVQQLRAERLAARQLRLAGTTSPILGGAVGTSTAVTSSLTSGVSGGTVRAAAGRLSSTVGAVSPNNPFSTVLSRAGINPGTFNPSSLFQTFVPSTSFTNQTVTNGAGSNFSLTNSGTSNFSSNALNALNFFRSRLLTTNNPAQFFTNASINPINGVLNGTTFTNGLGNTTPLVNSNATLLTNGMAFEFPNAATNGTIFETGSRLLNGTAFQQANPVTNGLAFGGGLGATAPLSSLSGVSSLTGGLGASSATGTNGAVLTNGGLSFPSPLFSGANISGVNFGFGSPTGFTQGQGFIA